MRALYADDLVAAQAGSYYTIIGTGEPLDEWVTNYEKALEDAGVGKPVEWFTTTGESVNAYAALYRKGQIYRIDKFRPEVTFLMFPLTDLNVGRLAMFRLLWQDRWFDDILQNMRVSHA